jgi:hypothetical protein
MLLLLSSFGIEKVATQFSKTCDHIKILDPTSYRASVILPSKIHIVAMWTLLNVWECNVGMIMIKVRQHFPILLLLIAYTWRNK